MACVPQWVTVLESQGTSRSHHRRRALLARPAREQLDLTYTYIRKAWLVRADFSRAFFLGR